MAQRALSGTGSSKGTGSSSVTPLAWVAPLDAVPPPMMEGRPPRSPIRMDHGMFIIARKKIVGLAVDFRFGAVLMGYLAPI